MNGSAHPIPEFDQRPLSDCASGTRAALAILNNFYHKHGEPGVTELAELQRLQSATRTLEAMQTLFGADVALASEHELRIAIDLLREPGT